MLWDKNCLILIINEPTRGKNTLDLFFTNETSLVTNVKVNKSTKSDHKKIEIRTRYSITNEKINKNIIKQKNINDVNFHNKNKWDIIKDITNSNIETSIVENSELIEQLIRLYRYNP